MNRDAPTDRIASPRGNLTLDERLERIEHKLDAILDASLPLRVRALEVLVYGGCSLALIAVAAALISGALKGGG